MKFWIVEGHVALEQPDEYQSAAVRYVLERFHHRLRMSCRVQNGSRQVVGYERLQLVQRIVERVDRKVDPGVVLRELEPSGIHVHSDDARTRLLCEQTDAQPNRADADHQRK